VRKESNAQPVSAPQTPSVAAVSKGIAKYATIGIVVLGLGSVAAYAAFQLYSERTGMAPESDPDVLHWQWNLVDGPWFALENRDPALSRKARTLIVAAWQAYTFGVGESTVIKETVTPDGLKLRTLPARLQRTEIYLRNAIQAAERDAALLLPETIPTLRMRHAAILEQLGEEYIVLAKQEYRQAWDVLSGKEPYGAFIAQKLGDLSLRLHDGEEAQEWWKVAVKLTQGATVSGVQDLAIPSSPALQRILVSNLVSRSAFLSNAGKFKDAEILEQQALNLLRTIPVPESMQSTSAPSALHALYLLQRSSALSLHLAESSYALRRPSSNSLHSLSSAADASERVARLLTGETPSQDASLNSARPPLLETYEKSPSMRLQASALLHDAQRSAAQAWNLLGKLHERVEGASSQKVLDCYGRAVYWASTPKADGQGVEANDAILEGDWRVYLDNYQRIKDAQRPSQ